MRGQHDVAHPLFSVTLSHVTICGVAQILTKLHVFWQEAVRRHELWRLSDNQGRPPGMIGMWPSHAVTFIDNHDTGECAELPPSISLPPLFSSTDAMAHAGMTYGRWHDAWELGLCCTFASPVLHRCDY